MRNDARRHVLAITEYTRQPGQLVVARLEEEVAAIGILPLVRSLGHEGKTYETLADEA